MVIFIEDVFRALVYSALSVFGAYYGGRAVVELGYYDQLDIFLVAALTLTGMVILAGRHRSQNVGV